ncbi:MAG: siderophore-interacting protein, partial [Alteromonadaceae bacterium]|nr:siderophore-interacting protein [Alteromonadaceae bacterium]
HWEPNAEFFEANEGDYLKLIFDSPEDKPSLRTFTVARVEEGQKRLAIDFAVHDYPEHSPTASQGGYAHWFAHTARRGNTIDVYGPNTKKSVIGNYDNTLFVVDATAIPALESVLRHQQTAGHIITVKCSDSLNERLTRYGLPVTTIHSTSALSDRANSLDIASLKGVWCAGEYQIMRTVRALVSEKLNVERPQQYFSSYWKQGMTEDGHKIFKQAQEESSI